MIDVNLDKILNDLIHNVIKEDSKDRIVNYIIFNEDIFQKCFKEEISEGGSHGDKGMVAE